MSKINISFKDSEKDLYEFLKNQLSPSIYIKEILKQQLENKNTKKENKSMDFDF